MRLELFGGLRAIEGKTIVTRFRTHRSALLLAYIALKPRRDHTREALGELLWPEEEPDKQRTRLRYELSVLRSALGRDPFRADGNLTLTLSPDIATDVAEFEAEQLAAVRAGTPEKRLPHLRKAMALCQGDPLPGVYETWAISEQERFREASFDVLTRLILDLEKLAQFDEARAFRRDAAARFPDRPLPDPLAGPPLTNAPIYVATVAGARYFGREAEIQTLREWIQRPGATRLITLTGMGGIGKTRLMLEATRETDAVFVPLAEAMQADQLWDAAATALKVSVAGGASPRMTILRALRERGRSVLLLDNLEQIAPQIAPLVAELLDACPALRVLATSRRPLRIAAEREFPLELLPGSDAVALFLDRARQARPDFASTPVGEALVGEIVQMLEGFPLAIELAAARATVLGPAQIREQLDKMLTFLVQIRPGANRRHSGLRAALEWSAALLSPERRRVWGRIAVFRDGFSLEAARLVCGDAAILDSLEELHLHSLLSVGFDGDEEARYTLRGVLRDFAEELLTQEESQDARTRHLSHFVGVSKGLYSAFYREEWNEKRDLFRRERENLRQAQRFALAQNNAEALLSLSESLAVIWFESGERAEFRALIAAVEPLLRDAPPSPRTIHFLGLCAADARRTGNQEASWRFWLQRLSAAEALQDTEIIINSLMEMIGQASDQHNFAAAHLYLTQLKERTPALAKNENAVTIAVLEARVAWAEGKSEEALNKADAALVLLEANREAVSRLYSLTYLARLYRALEGGERAERLLREAIEIARKDDLLFVLGLLSLELARHRRAQNRRDEAERAYRIALGVNTEIESPLREETAAEYNEYRQAGVQEKESEIESLPWRSFIGDIWKGRQ